MGRDVTSIFADIDSFDVDRLVRHMTPDAEFRFANIDAVVGREAIRERVAEFYSTIAGLRHGVHEVWEVGATVIVRTEVEYTRHDGLKVRLPNADILYFEGDLVRDWRIYIDLAPLYD